MSYTEEIIKDSRDRFGDKEWISIASSRIDAAYKNRGNDNIGEIEYYNFTLFGIKVVGKAIIVAIVLISIIA